MRIHRLHSYLMADSHIGTGETSSPGTVIVLSSTYTDMAVVMADTRARMKIGSL